MRDKQEEPAYEQAARRAQEAWQACLSGDVYYAQELLLRTRTEVKRLGGDLPILGHFEHGDGGKSTSFVTRSYAEAEAWGWLEMASGLFQLVRERPGTSLVHFKRAWRIWRPWSTLAPDDASRLMAARERVRAALWLSAGWSRMTGERAAHASEAVWRAALSEIARIDAGDLLTETTKQQAQLPAMPGTTRGEKT